MLLYKMPRKGYSINPQVFIGRKEAEFRNEMLNLPTDTMYNGRDYNIKDSVIFSKHKNTFSLGMSNNKKRVVKSSSKSLKKTKTKKSKK